MVLDTDQNEQKLTATKLGIKLNIPVDKTHGIAFLVHDLEANSATRWGRFAMNNRLLCIKQSQGSFSYSLLVQ